MKYYPAIIQQSEEFRKYSSHEQTIFSHEILSNRAYDITKWIQIDMEGPTKFDEQIFNTQ